MRNRSLGILFLLGAAAATACKSEEEEVVDRFLLAAQRGDDATVALLSMVAFPDELRDWELLSLSGERREGYRVPELRRRLSEAEHRRDEQFEAFGEFRQQNYEELAAIQRRRRDDPEARLTGRALELSTRWDAFREERRQVVNALHEAELALEWEIRRATKSLQRESAPEYLTGETVERDALVRAATSTGEQSFRVTLTRYDVRNQFGAVEPSRWIVTEVGSEAPSE
jgi:hypothetical protein